jgi:excisionase family DNA binding protein
MDMEDIVLSSIPISELEAKFAQVVEDKLKAFLQTQTPIKNDNSMEYATRKEVSERLRISLPTLNTLTKDEILKGYRIGGRVLYKWEEVEAVLSQITTTKYKRKSLI